MAVSPVEGMYEIFGVTHQMNGNVSQSSAMAGDIARDIGGVSV